MRNSAAIRHREISKAKSLLLRSGYPRVLMFFLVMLTGLAGFMTSVLALSAGVEHMGLRYIISMFAAYFAFLIMLWMWIKLRSSSNSDCADAPVDMAFDVPSGYSHAELPVEFAGKGGTFDGGGASADWGDGGGDAVGEGLGAVAQAEEAAIPIFVIIGLLAVLFSGFVIVFSLVSSAPLLFAELIVDSVLSASLYKRLTGVDQEFWLKSAVSRTITPFVCALALIGAVGFGLQHYAKDAHTIGAAIKQISSQYSGKKSEQDKS